MCKVKQARDNVRLQPVYPGSLYPKQTTPKFIHCLLKGKKLFINAYYPRMNITIFHVLYESSATIHGDKLHLSSRI